MKLIFTFAFTQLYCLALGQLKYPSKQEVDKVIRLTISQKMTKKNSSCEYGQCGEWWTANNDSTFYKSDTVKFYNSSNIVYNDTIFCTSLVWDFGKGNTFNDSQALMCQEPPTRSIKSGTFLGQDRLRTPNKYDIVFYSNKTFINILVDTAIFETFEVVCLEKTTQNNLGDKSYVLTLVRQK